MKYLPATMILIAMVMLMAGAGKDRAAAGWRLGEVIVLVIIGSLLVVAFFVVIVDRTL